MTFDVVLLRQIEDGYIARPVLWPDSEVHGNTAQEALERVRGLIHDLLDRTQFVKVEVDVPGHTIENPWVDKAGMFSDDPTWDDFLIELANHRRRLDETSLSEQV